MNSLLKLLSKNIEGGWLSQQSIYYLEKKKVTINKFKKNIVRFVNSKLVQLSYSYICKYESLPNEEIIYNYSITCDKNHNSGELKKIYSKYIQAYKIELKSTSCVQIKYKAKKITYIEYTYIINKNLRISIIIIKKNHNYVAVCFNSDIKII